MDLNQFCACISSPPPAYQGSISCNALAQQCELISVLFHESFCLLFLHPQCLPDEGNEATSHDMRHGGREGSEGRGRGNEGGPPGGAAALTSPRLLVIVAAVVGVAAVMALPLLSLVSG